MKRKGMKVLPHSANPHARILPQRGMRMLAGTLAVMSVSCMLYGCGEVRSETGTSVLGSEGGAASENSQLTKLKIGVDILTPFFYVDENDNYAGIDAEIAEEACKRAGYEPDFVEINWNEREKNLQNGTVDCLWTAFAENGREDQYLWTQPYLESELRILTDAKSPDKNIESIRKHGSVAVRSGSKAEEVLLEEYGGENALQVYSCGTFEMAETALVKGYTGALSCHEAVLEQVMNNYPGAYCLLDGSLMTAELGVAFRQGGSTEERDRIDDALSAMKEDGTIREIWEKYGQMQLAGGDHA